MSAVLEWALRLHLAAFYFDGRFASPAMRAVGARLAYARPEQEAPRARYAVLGLLLLLQLAAEASSAGAETAGRWRAAAGAALSARFSGRSEAIARGTGARGGHMGQGEEGKDDSVRGNGQGPVGLGGGGRGVDGWLARRCGCVFAVGLELKAVRVFHSPSPLVSAHAPVSHCNQE